MYYAKYKAMCILIKYMLFWLSYIKWLNNALGYGYMPCSIVNGRESEFTCILFVLVEETILQETNVHVYVHAPMSSKQV